jgi:hypothetical protein
MCSNNSATKLKSKVLLHNKYIHTAISPAIKQCPPLLIQHQVGMYYTDYLPNTALTTNIQEEIRTERDTAAFSTAI